MNGLDVDAPEDVLNNVLEDIDGNFGDNADTCVGVRCSFYVCRRLECKPP